jgi:RNA polymerase sigma factor (sigma-70 family)
MKLCGDKELIKDCIQDLFIKIWNNRENLNDTTSVKYYLFTSLKHKLIDTLKSPSQKLKTDDDVMSMEMIDSSDSDGEFLYFQKERVFKAMNKLSKHQQKVLQMKFYENQSNQEIADELGITIQSVYNSVFKTLRSLRKQLEIGLLLILFNF